MLVIIVFMKAKINNLKAVKELAENSDSAKIVDGQESRKSEPLN